jgi:hypothetical protein
VLRPAQPLCGPVIDWIKVAFYPPAFNLADIALRSGAAIVTAARAGTGVIVCYEADAIDPATQLGWTVVATGPATLVDDPHPAARYRQALEPWVAVAGAMDEVIRIRPGIITGFRVDGDIKPTLNGG